MRQDASVLGTDEAIRALDRRLALAPGVAAELNTLIKDGRAQVLQGDKTRHSTLYVALEQPSEIYGYFVCEPEDPGRTLPD
jgi:hypothetical protein